VISLQEGLESKKNLIGENYFANKDLLGAFLLYQWVIHYQQGLSVINELPIVPRRVLDVCSGPGAFAFSALRHGAQEVYATDQNQQALTLGAEICGRYGLPLTIREWSCLNKPLPIEGKFDLIIAGHCLHELFPASIKGWQEKQHQFIKYLMSRLKPEGFLLLVDDSQNEANRRILQLRDQFVKEGVPIQAPCVWKGECPALKVANSPCYAQREFEKPFLIKEIQRAANINLGSLKMSYIIFRHPQANWPNLSQENLYRVISPPVESFHGKRYYLCGTDGKKQLESHLKSHPAESRAFEYLRRGELISIDQALENRNSLNILSETKLSIEAACGKPLNENLNNS
jgi:SAM-dependent methyltransferase